MEVTFETTEFERACGEPKEIVVEDKLEKLIAKLEEREKSRMFDGAKKILDKIKEILDEPKTWSYPLHHKNCRTLFAVHQMIRANTIRLRYKDMDISGYLQLLYNIRQRLFNKIVSVNTQRKIVAEEMSKLNLFPQMITEKWQLRETKAPNRAFMDILYKVRPDFAKDDILRREYTNLCNAWEKKDQKALNETRMKITELGGTDFTTELRKE